MNNAKIAELITLAGDGKHQTFPEFSALWDEIAAEMVRDGEATSLPDAAVKLHKICEDGKVKP